MKNIRLNRGFTLLELIIVVGILAVLGTIAAVFINPVERYRETSDAKRMSELKTLTEAISVYRASGGSLSAASSTIVYTSLPDTDDAYPEECDEYNLPSPPSGYTYYCALKSNFRKVNGNGWVPLNLSQQLSVLPVDPTNDQYQYYTFTSDGADYEITAVLNSSKYQPMMAKDSGDNDNFYEKGSKLTLSVAPAYQIAKNYPEGQTVYTPSLFGDKIVYAAGAAGQAAFFIDADHIKGNNAFYWDDTNERLGIGTSYPKGKLDVAGGVSIGSYAGTNTPPSNGMIISGNVGIGTPSPTANLEIGTGGVANTRIRTWGNAVGRYFDIYNDGGDTTLSTNVGHMYISVASDLRLSVGNGQEVNINSGQLVVKKATGNVGIGTTSPSQKLEVVGNIRMITNSPDLRIQSFSTAGDYLAQLSFADSGGAYWKIGQDLRGLGARDFSINYNDVSRVFIDTGGNVGIGTTSPSEKLHVVGNIYKTGTVSFVEDYPGDPTKQIVYVSLEGPEAGTYIRGQGQLINGETEIQLPEHFSLVTEPNSGLTAQVTPIDENNGLKVVGLSNSALKVKELNNGQSNTRFYYFVNGIRKGYENFNPVQAKK